MVKRPKGKLFALLAVFVAIGLVTASGAFSSVQAERTVDVSTAGDGSALLQLQLQNTNLGDQSADALTISITNVNLNAISDMGIVFTITNNGNDDLNSVYIADRDSEAPSGFNLGGTAGDDPVEYRADSNPTGTGTDGNIEGSGRATSLDTGESLDIRMVIDTQGQTTTGGLTVNDIVIVAEQ